jgi:hypothetical protein
MKTPESTGGGYFLGFLYGALQHVDFKEKDMKRCETCKHWERLDRIYYGEVTGIGRCHAVAEFWDATVWNNDQDMRTVRPEYAEKLAFVQDEMSCYAELRTLVSFGCVQHETERGRLNDGNTQTNCGISAAA